MLDFRVETFLNACKTLNFTKTAEELCITQPAVSQHIKYIEKYYNVKLFYFKGKKMYLTKEGSFLQNALTTMILDQEHLKKTLKKYSEKNKMLKFGVTLTVGEYIIPTPLAKYLNDSENNQLSMKVSNTLNLLNDLNHGAIDFAIVEGYFPQNEYDYRVYSREKYIGACAVDSKYANGSYTIDQLFEATVITREPGSGTREILQRSLEDRNFTIDDFSNVMEISNLNAIKKLVRNNCGITFMYEAALKEAIDNNFLCKINITDFDIAHNITFIWRKNSLFADNYIEIFNKLKKFL